MQAIILPPPPASTQPALAFSHFLSLAEFTPPSPLPESPRRLPGLFLSRRESEAGQLVRIQGQLSVRRAVRFLQGLVAPPRPPPPERTPGGEVAAVAAAPGGRVPCLRGQGGPGAAPHRPKLPSSTEASNLLRPPAGRSFPTPRNKTERHFLFFPLWERGKQDPSPLLSSAPSLLTLPNPFCLKPTGL